MRVLNIHGVDDIRPDPVDPPTPGRADVVVRMKACGVCGSDLGAIRHGGVKGPGGGVMPLGHEAAGEIAAVGADVTGVFVGQRVVINPMNSPGLIGNGGPDGAFTEALLVREARLGDNLHPIPGDLPWDVAALTEPLAVSLHVVNRAEARPGDRVVVFGCGAIGLGCIVWLIERGISDVVAIDIAAEPLARAKALGARAVIDASREPAAEGLAVLHGTHRLFSRDVVGSDIFIDAAGAPGLVGDILKMGKLQSRLVIAAAYHAPLSLDPGALLTSEMRITAALGYPSEMPEVLAALPRLRDTVAPMISHRFAFADVLEAFRVAATPQSAKVIVAFEDEAA